MTVRSLASTLRLPKSTFPARRPPRSPPSAKSTSALYALQSPRTDTRTSFTLHDGPPYANGDLHMGHALNKILKDVVNRTEILFGKRVSYIPGWDCHGLPIEMKALLNVKDRNSLSPLEIRSMARDLATKTVEAQKACFQGWGVMGDWDKAYRTMDNDYEMRQLEVFRDMAERGLIYRRFKPVYWSPSSGTALAEAELEYNEDHQSKAAYIKFPVSGKVGDHEDVSALIWTTTPWTIPSNKAIAVGEKLEYVIVQTEDHGKLVVGKERLSHLDETGMLGEYTLLRDDLVGENLLGLGYTHHLFPSAPVSPIIKADFVSSESGTGLVHLAPGHGMDDYLVCQSIDIPPYSPVDDHGLYTSDTHPELHGLDVTKDGTEKVLKLLSLKSALIHVSQYKHKYPYDWRTKKPIIIRATAQWFADVSVLKSPAVSALSEIAFTPETSRSRLTAFVQGRSEWCISRQRAWGVPIPALYDAENGGPLLTKTNITHIISELSKRGTDAWFDPSVQSSVWLAPKYRDNGRTYIRKFDTMDVWFDSGTSWKLLPDTADLYLEGTDQARGWFQSSLLTSLASTSRPPFRQILTHGFVLDKNSRKMSKSLGNVISPMDILSGKLTQPGGLETLRYWAAASDYTRDISVSPQSLSRISEAHRKARNTTRFLLGILSDFDPAKDSVPYSQLTKLDQTALHHLSTILNSVRSDFRTYAFAKGLATLSTYTVANLSSFYLDVIKDRVYSDVQDSTRRRAAQTVSFAILRGYVSHLAAVLPDLAVDAWEHCPDALRDAAPQVERNLMRFFEPEDEWENPEALRGWELVDRVRSAVMQGFEKAKKEGKVKVSLEVQVEVKVEDQGMLEELVRWGPQELEQAWIVSGVSISETPPAAGEGRWEEKVEFDGGVVVVRRAAGGKCQRCWQYTAPRNHELCGRCDTVLRGLDAGV